MLSGIVLDLSQVLPVISVHLSSPIFCCDDFRFHRPESSLESLAALIVQGFSAAFREQKRRVKGSSPCSGDQSLSSRLGPGNPFRQFPESTWRGQRDIPGENEYSVLFIRRFQPQLHRSQHIRFLPAPVFYDPYTHGLQNFLHLISPISCHHSDVSDPCITHALNRHSDHGKSIYLQQRLKSFHPSGSSCRRDQSCSFHGIPPFSWSSSTHL